jgi:hypothetical protein
MSRKKKSARKSRSMTCDMCGIPVPKTGKEITIKSGGFSYNFDSDNCLLIFRKLRELYGESFFRSSKS